MVKSLFSTPISVSNLTTVVRHGDLLFRAIDQLPAKSGMTLQKDAVLALGEATGHKHILVGNAQIYNRVDEEGTETKYLQVNEESVINHEEHKTVTLPKNNYVMVQEREFDVFTEMGRDVYD
tara:strand:+ start:817 stop:1182 length:366 start_codon:yes stop_codon:yes gene_type:complete